MRGWCFVCAGGACVEDRLRVTPWPAPAALTAAGWAMRDVSDPDDTSYPSVITQWTAGVNDDDRFALGLSEGRITCWIKTETSYADTLGSATVPKGALQVRSCSEPSCDGEPFVGPAGDPGGVFDERDNADLSPARWSLAGVVPPNRYFHRVTLMRAPTGEGPLIHAVSVFAVSP